MKPSNPTPRIGALALLQTRLLLPAGQITVAEKSTTPRVIRCLPDVLMHIVRAASFFNWSASTVSARQASAPILRRRPGSKLAPTSSAIPNVFSKPESRVSSPNVMTRVGDIFKNLLLPVDASLTVACNAVSAVAESVTVPNSLIAKSVPGIASKVAQAHANVPGMVGFESPWAYQTALNLFAQVHGTENPVFQAPSNSDVALTCSCSKSPEKRSYSPCGSIYFVKYIVSRSQATSDFEPANKFAVLWNLALGNDDTLTYSRQLRKRAASSETCSKD